MNIQGTNISMIRGDSEAINVTVRDAADVAIPLVAGDTIRFTVKESLSSEIPTIQKTITEFNDGAALITIDPTDTKNLKFGTYVYDIQLTRENGSVKTIIIPSGFKVLGEVSHE